MKNLEFEAKIELTNGQKMNVILSLGEWDGVSNDDHIYYWLDNSQEMIDRLSFLSVKPLEIDGFKILSADEDFLKEHIAPYTTVYCLSVDSRYERADIDCFSVEYPTLSEQAELLSSGEVFMMQTKDVLQKGEDFLSGHWFFSNSQIDTDDHKICPSVFYDDGRGFNAGGHAGTFNEFSKH